jgi:type I restriction enzyme S subunit
MTELGALPEEWEVVKVKEYFIEIKQKVGFENKDKYNPVAVGELGLRFREQIYKHKTKLTEKTETYLIFPYSSICFGLGSKTLAVDVNTIKNSVYSVSAAYKIFKFDDNLFNPIFFRFYVMSVKDLWSSKLLVQSVRQGKKIDKVIFYDLSIPLPTLAEQQKIAAVLSAVQTAKEKTEAVIEATKALKKSMMKHLFTYGPVSPQEAETVPLKETEIGPVPEEWEVVRLGEVADIVMGQSPPGSSYNEAGVGLPFLQGKAEFGPLHPLHIKHTTTPMKIAPKNSVLLSVRAPVGDVNLANIDYCIGRGLASISLSSGKNIFLFYILTYLKNEIEKEGTGSIFKAINKTKLLNFKIPLPPLPIQQKIAAILSTIDAKIEAEENKKKALEELFKALLHNLITAKIRVNNLEFEDV